MKTDQFDYTDDDVILARCISMLVERLYDKEGNPVDIADKKGREDLIRTISSFPKTIHVQLCESDRELLKEHIAAVDKKQKELIEQYEENRKLIKSWFWWIVGVVGIAFIAMAVCAFMLFK